MMTSFQPAPVWSGRFLPNPTWLLQPRARMARDKKQHKPKAAGSGDELRSRSAVLRHAPLVVAAVLLQLFLTWGYFHFQSAATEPDAADREPPPPNAAGAFKTARSAVPAKCPAEWPGCPPVSGADWEALAELEAAAEAAAGGGAAAAAAGGGVCEDTAEGCAAWAADGQCAANPAFMLETCAKACGACSAGGAAAEVAAPASEGDASDSHQVTLPTDEDLEACGAAELLSPQRVPGMHLLCVLTPSPDAAHPAVGLRLEP